MGITRLAITRPLAILMLIVGLVIMGIVSFSMMRVDRMPNISMGFVSVNVAYPGASAADVEELIAKPIESAVGGIPGVYSISSTSSEGRASVNVQLVEGANVDQAAIDASRRVAAIRSRLPVDAGEPAVNKADPNARAIMNIVLSGDRPSDELYDYATDVLQPALQSVLGVADVTVIGGRQKEVRVEVDFTKLESYGLTLQQLNNSLTRENISNPAGAIKEGRRTVSVRTLGLFQSADELKDLIIGTTNAGPVVGTTTTGPVFLRDVADVYDGFKDQTRILRLNGKESVGLSITKQSDANSLQVADDVKETMAVLQTQLPPDVGLIITNDTSYYTRAALESVQTDLALAVLLTGFVLLLFLHSWRHTLIVLLAIPTSLISTFLMMYALGFSLNTISMMALALSIGILVDGSIVVLENIHRHMQNGEAPMVAALSGITEIGMAVVAITFTDVVVYVPVAFMQGNIGKMFREYGLTIACATLFSLFVSLTLTPMLASRFLKAHEEGEGGGYRARFSNAWERNYERLANTYAKVLGWALGRRPVIIVVGLTALAISLSFVPLNLVGSEYAPQEDDNQFEINVQMPPGTSLQGTDQAIKQVEAGLSKIPEIQTIYASVGAGGGMGPGNNTRGGNIAIQTINKRQRSRSIRQIMDDARRITSGIPELNGQASQQSVLSGGGGGGANVRLYGDNMATLMELAGRVEQLMRGIPGVVDVRNTGFVGQPEVRAKLDRKRMAELGLGATQVGNMVRTAVSGSAVSQLRKEGESQLDITVISKDASRRISSDIAQVPLASINGLPVRLGQVADIVYSDGPAQIQRTDRRRVVSVNGVVSGRPLGDVARDLRAALGDLAMPDGYTYLLAGQVQQLDAAFAALLAALTLSIILIYMLMVALFESFLYPLAIMFALPVSLVGAFFGLLLTGNTFNIFSMIGIIMLMGIVAKNAILLVDYTNTLRKRGLPRNEAIIQAGRTRLRPILMTMCTIVCAMTPLAMKFEAGAESRAPMAVVVIGGVLSSTMLTLVLVPVVYTYVDGLQSVVGRLRAKAPARAEMSPYPVVSGGSNGHSEE